MNIAFNFFARNLLVFLVVMFFPFAMSGCAKVVPEQNRIMFEESGSGEQKAGSLNLNYTYQKVNNTMNFHGELTSKWKYTSMTVRLWFFDEGGNVLSQKVVYYSAMRTSLRSGVRFDSEIELPPEVAGFSLKVTGEQYWDY